MQLRRTFKTAKPENDFERSLEQEFLSAWRELATIINKGLNFVDNFKCDSVAVTDTGLANAEFTVAHGLKKIPSGYLVIRRNKSGVVYDSGTTFTTTDIYLKCSAANTSITILVF